MTGVRILEYARLLPTLKIMKPYHWCNRFMKNLKTKTKPTILKAMISSAAPRGIIGAALPGISRAKMLGGGISS